MNSLIQFLSQPHTVFIGMSIGTLGFCWCFLCGVAEHWYTRDAAFWVCAVAGCLMLAFSVLFAIVWVISVRHGPV